MKARMVNVERMVNNLLLLKNRMQKSEYTGVGKITRRKVWLKAESLM